MSTTSSPPPTSATGQATEKTPESDHVERVETNDRVPIHDNKYGDDKFRTYGDGEDHDHEPPVCSSNNTPFWNLYLHAT